MPKLSVQTRICGLPRSAGAAFAAALTILLLCSAPIFADQTRFWRQSDYDDFQKGTVTGIALRSDGKVVLAPKFTQIADANLAYLRTVRMDSHGNVFAAGGSNAKVIRLDSAGKSSTFFESPEMTAQTLALDKGENLYVGTSPDGKIYKVTPAGQKTVFFDPKTKYIWDTVFAPDGTLYVATGDAGRIFAVTPDGKSEMFYGGGETHIRTLALDGKGNLLAGTEPNGLVLRISLGREQASAAPAKRGGDKRADQGDAAQPADSAAGTKAGRRAYVVYETAKREITALVPDDKGTLYVAAIGEKTRPTPVTAPAGQTPAQTAQAVTQTPGQNITVTVGGAPVGQQALATPFVPFPTVNSSSVYRIAADGSPQEIWSAREDVVYAMGLSADNKLLLGIGNQGAVMKLEDDGVFSRLAKTESEQVTGFARATSGKVYVATANPGKVFTLGPEIVSEGTLESQTFDAHIFSRWGRVTWWGEADQAAAASRAGNSSVDLYVRSGNTSDPQNNWSAWFGPYRNGGEAEAPAARFVQWKAVLRGGSDPAPAISWVDVAYLPKNIAPRIPSIAMQNPGIRLSAFGGQQPNTPGQSTPAQLRMPPAPGAQSPAARMQSENTRYEPPPQGVNQKGFQAVLWTAEDDNNDDLTYAIYYRGEGETAWRLLKDKLDQKSYSWDTTSMSDGPYYLRIVASDEKSNPAGEALTCERQSDRFVVDNTPPTVSELAADKATAGADVTVRFRATDATSAIVRAQYSLDAGDWTQIRPMGDISDSTEERYAITLRKVGSGEHTISVRVYDQFENEAAGKMTFAVPAGR